MSYERQELQTMPLNEFHEALRSQGKERIEDVSFRCPRCGTLQSAQDLIEAGAGQDFADVEKYTAFSCIGRFDTEKGCDWTLGGLLQIHELQVQTEDGEMHPRFFPAT